MILHIVCVCWYVHNGHQLRSVNGSLNEFTRFPNQLLIQMTFAVSSLHIFDLLLTQSQNIAVSYIFYGKPIHTINKANTPYPRDPSLHFDSWKCVCVNMCELPLMRVLFFIPQCYILCNKIPWSLTDPNEMCFSLDSLCIYLNKENYHNLFRLN